MTTYFEVVGDFDPGHVTDDLGIQPTRIWRRGESLVKGMRPRKHDGWSLKVGGEPSWSFESQLSQLFALIGPRSKEIAELRQRLQAKVHITCEAWVNQGSPAIHFDESIVAAAAQLGADIEVDIMVSGAAEEEDEFLKWAAESGQH